METDVMLMPLSHESARVMLYIWDDKSATVSSLHSTQRRQGHATALMQKVIDLADEEGWNLVLSAQQFGHPIGPDNQVLVEFYRRFGFQVVNLRAPVKTMMRPRKNYTVHNEKSPR